MQLPGVLAIVIALATAPQLGVTSLISQLDSPDPQAVASAAAELKSRGTGILPALVKSAQDNQSCQVLYMLAGIVREIQAESPVPNATLLHIAQGKCKMKPPQDLLMHRQAAYALVDRTDGVATVVTMLQTGDTSQRRTAVLAFVDEMNVLTNEAAKTVLTPEHADALTIALTALARSMHDSDEYVRCGAFKSLATAQKAPSDAMKHEAAKSLEGVPVPKCPF